MSAGVIHRKVAVVDLERGDSRVDGVRYERRTLILWPAEDLTYPNIVSTEVNGGGYGRTVVLVRDFRKEDGAPNSWKVEDRFDRSFTDQEWDGGRLADVFHDAVVAAVIRS